MAQTRADKTPVRKPPASTSVAARDEPSSSAGALPAELASLGNSLPAVLLPYQRELLRATATSQMVVVEKSRRIGATWGVAADAVLTGASARSSGGMDVFYIGFNLDMTREFIDTCAMWAKAFVAVAVEVNEFVFRGQSEKDDEGIQAFRISFASGFEIVALCSRPRSLRGRQGYVIIDEAAFHDELSELLKAALALLMWGGRVLVISTHNGQENAYNQLVEDCRAKRKPYTLVRITLDDAVADGLVRRICLVRGQAWSPEYEAEWVKKTRDFYGDDAGEELDCIAKATGGKYFSRALLEARAVEAPVLRWSLPDSFVDLAEERRFAECRAWCDENIAPLLAALDPDDRSFLGEDFGRNGDLTSLVPLTMKSNLARRSPFLIELRNVPFQQQEQVAFYLCDGLPRFSGGAFDARGNGQYLAERARQRYGAECIAEVMLSERWYLENVPPTRAALEDDTLSIVKDAQVLDDFRAFELVRGIPRVVERTKGDTGKRHGDTAIAYVLAYFASRELDAGPIRFATSGRRTSVGAFAGDPEMTRSRGLAGWND